MSTPNMVPMLAPDGTAGYIPSDRVNDALKMGGKLGVEMAAPDGTKGIIPRENIVAGIQAGGKVLHDSAQYTTQFEKDRNPDNQPGFLSSAASEVGNIVKGIPAAARAMADPLGTGLKQAADLAVNDHLRENNGRSGGYRVAAALGTPLGVNVAGMERQADVGNAAGVAGIAIGDTAPVVASELVKGAAKLPGKVTAKLQGSLAPRMAEVPAGEQFSRGEVLDAARQNGVNLDVAQATDAPAANVAKKANQYSIGSQGVYGENSGKNLAALDQWANAEQSKYSPGTASREVVGGQMQKALQSDLGSKQAQATQLFNDLDRNVGNAKPDAATVYDKAKDIVSQNASYFEKNPALKQSRAWQIVNDLADRAEKTQPTTSTVASKLVDESGRAFTKDVTNAPKVKPDTWTDLQKLRTDLMSETRSPEIIGTRAEGWLKQLTGEVDNSMTGAASGMSGSDLAKFRAANSVWEQIKSTYDNPQHPFYHSLRSQFPSQVPGMLAKGTPELAQQVRATLGSLEGPFQRQFVENLLNGKDGVMDLGRLNQRLKGIPQDHLEAMLGADGAKQIRLLGQVAKRVIADNNPSGTAKVAVPAAEGSALLHPSTTIPTVVEVAGQRVGAKLMNNPRVVDYLTKPKK